MNKENYKLYAELEQQKKDIEEKQKKIKEEIVSEMIEQQADTIKADFGTFSLTKRKTWKYSDTVEKLNEQVKTQKKLEEENGTATFEENQSLMFRAK